MFTFVYSCDSSFFQCFDVEMFAGVHSVLFERVNYYRKNVKNNE